MTRVTLGPDQVRMAKLVGSIRHRTDVAAGSADRHYPRDDRDEEQSQQAAGAEIAACRALGAWWAATDSIGADNAGADLRLGVLAFQVRWTRYREGFLPLHDHDADHQPFVLVTGWLPTYDIRGVIVARLGKRDEFWRTVNPKTGQPMPCPCWCVPQSALQPIRVARRVATVVEVGT